MVWIRCEQSSAEELTDDFTDSQTLLDVVTEVSSELVDTVDNLATAVLSTTGTDDVELIDDLTALMTGAMSTQEAVAEVSNDAVDNGNDLTTAVLNRVRVELADEATATEVTNELVRDNDDSSPAALCTTGADTEPTDDLTALTTRSVTMPAAATEEHPKLADGDDDVATAMLSTDKQITPDTSVCDKAALTKVTCELVLGNDDLAITAVSSTGANVDITDELTALMPSAGATRGSVTEVSTELVDVGSDLPTAVLSTAEEHTADTEVTDEAILCDVTSERVHSIDDLAPVTWSTTDLGTKMTDDLSDDVDFASKDSAPVVLSTAGAVNTELIADLPALTTRSVTLLTALTEVSTELVCGDDDFATASMGRTGEHSTNTEVPD